MKLKILFRNFKEFSIDIQEVQETVPAIQRINSTLFQSERWFLIALDEAVAFDFDNIYFYNVSEIYPFLRIIYTDQWAKIEFLWSLTVCS